MNDSSSFQTMTQAQACHTKRTVNELREATSAFTSTDEEGGNGAKKNWLQLCHSTGTEHGRRGTARLIGSHFVGKSFMEPNDMVRTRTFASEAPARLCFHRCCSVFVSADNSVSHSQVDNRGLNRTCYCEPALLRTP